MRNGKGKEYRREKDFYIYDGEFLNGKKMEKEKNIVIMN